MSDHPSRTIAERTRNTTDMTDQKLTLKEQAELIRKERMRRAPAKTSGSIAEQTGPLDKECLHQPNMRRRPDMVLEETILSHLHEGYRVTYRNEMSAQLVKPTRASCFWNSFVIVCSFGTAIPLLILYHLVKRDKGLYIRVTPSGSIEKVRSGPLLSPVGWLLLGFVLFLTLYFLVLLLGFEPTTF